jgi:hypothetical protein
MSLQRGDLTKQDMIELIELWESDLKRVILKLLTNYGKSAQNMALKAADWDMVNQAKGKASAPVELKKFLDDLLKEDIAKRRKNQ